MEKNYVLTLVDNDGDYGVARLLDVRSARDIARSMYETGRERLFLITYDYEVEARLYCYGAIDLRFVELLRDSFLDYDDSKARDFEIFSEAELGGDSIGA